MWLYIEGWVYTYFCNEWNKQKKKSSNKIIIYFVLFPIYQQSQNYL